VLRRFHVPRLFVGDVPLDSTQSRHARDVLRLVEGTTVELFTSEGPVASGAIQFAEAGGVLVRVSSVTQHSAHPTRLVVASAIPKGERADWMIEKLSELGVSTFIPLHAERSVTIPKGNTKFERWSRIATESAKQSRRSGVMSIEPVTGVDQLIAARPAGYVLSTALNSQPLTQTIKPGSEILLVVGPEGGWTDRELEAFGVAGYLAVGLTQTVLRTETAAIVGAGVVAVVMSGELKERG